MKLYSQMFLLGVVPMLACIRTCSVDPEFARGLGAPEHVDKIHRQTRTFMALRISTSDEFLRTANGKLVLVVRNAKVRHWVINDRSLLYAHSNDAGNSTWVLYDSYTNKMAPVPRSEADPNWDIATSSNRQFANVDGTVLVNLMSVYEALTDCIMVLFIGNGSTQAFFNTNDASMADKCRTAIAVGDAVFLAEDDDFQRLSSTIGTMEARRANQ